MPEFRLTLLGAFELSGKAPCAVVSKKAQALLAFLAMPAGQPHRRDKLAAMLWADRSEESARQNLRQCLTAIRRAWDGGQSFPLVAEGDLLRLDPASLTIDACEFEEALRCRRSQDLEYAFALYRGDLLEGLNLQGQPFEEWLIGERRRLRVLAIEGLGQLLQFQEHSGAREQATQTAIRLLTVDGLQEPVHRALMRLHHEAGNTAQALRQYGICEKTLRRELAVEPEAATKELRREILRSRSSTPAGSSRDEIGLARIASSESFVPSGGDVLREVDTPLVPPNRPSVAVLPFICRSDDPKHDFFADALAEDVITTLSGIEPMMVIAHSSTSTYKGRQIDARKAGRELGVGHVLEGSVRADGNRMRITAQLINASNGAQVWADRYDRQVSDAFAVQDEIAQEIVTALEVQLTYGDQIRTWRRDAASPEAYRHFANAREAHLTFSRSGMARCREEAQKAVAINPNFATMYASWGFSHASEARFGWDKDREVALSKAKDLARKALSIEVRCAMAHSLLTYVAMQERRFEDALSEAARAVAIHPGDAEAYHMLAMARIYNGDFMEGARLELRSLRLNPLALENSLVELGRAYFHMGRFDDAVTVLERVCRAKPNWLTARTLLGGCYYEGGRPDLARQVVADILRIKPDFSLAWWSQLQLYRRNEDLEHHLSGLRLMGLPAVASHVDSRASADFPRATADRPSLAVLPFENLSQDAALSLVADGLVEDVISLLARIPGFFVIARRSSFFYRDRSLDLRQVGRELGIRYVVAGSLRSSGERLRIVVNLFEVESGMQHWAQQYDVEHGDAFEIQSNIARDIMTELQPQLARAELTNIRRQRPDNLGAWAHYHAAVGAITLEGFNEQSMARAIDHLGKATELDRDFALAYSLKALWSVAGVSLSLLPDAAAQYSAKEAERAVALDPNGPEVIAYAGCAFVRMGDVCHGRELIERAVELDPSNPQARVTLGATQVRAGEFERGIENMRLGIRLSPRDYGLTFWGMGLAIALSRAGRLEEAFSQVQSVCRRDGGLYMARVVMALLLTRLGREAEARAAIAEARRIRPVLSLKEIARFLGDPVAIELETAWK